MIKNKPSTRLVKHIIRSYSRLAENPEGRTLLKTNLPEEMKTEEFYNSLDDSSKKWLMNLMRLLKEDNRMNNNQNGNIGVNNINININMNHNNMNMGMPMDMNNNPNLNNNMTIPANMMMMNPMNLQNNQGYMMPQQNIGDFNFQMYNESYLNNNMYMGNQPTNNGFNNVNYYGNFQK